MPTSQGISFFASSMSIKPAFGPLKYRIQVSGIASRFISVKLNVYSESLDSSPGEISFSCWVLL